MRTMKRILLVVLGTTSMAFSAMEYTVDDGTTFLWQMNEPSGSLIYDAAANHYDGNDALDRTAGKFGNGITGGVYQFGGNHTTPVVSGSFTVEAWIMAPSGGWQSGNQTIVGMFQYESPWGHNFYFGLSEGKLQFGFYNGGSWCSGISADAITVTDDWVHVACSYDMSDPQWCRAHYYVNGVEVSGGGDNLDGTPTGGGYLYIGKSSFSDTPFSGLIDEIRLSSVARSVSELSPNLIPEPMTMGLLALGGLGVVIRRK